MDFENQDNRKKDKITPESFMAMVTEIVASYVSSHQVDMDDIPALVQKVSSSLASLKSEKYHAMDRPEPAVDISDSVTEDYIVCLEDGKHLKMLKRHLKTSYNMTPEQYRERWHLPADYPMVAPSYAQQRSSLAVKIGLGKKRKKLSQVA